ncbi:MAG TPA: branched-chain amino acid ABC transporter substrate-binding protein, partial [Anaerolineae bacterium]|nr:branched-chain amino acid ABC transporter substrate-binding protein [Anaerolineae bacterium]
DALATLAYDAMNLMLNAIQTAGSEDTAKVKDAMQNTNNYPVVSGDISFDANGNPLKNIPMIMIKDGGYHFGGFAKP